jgi:hypothetical protein
MPLVVSHRGVPPQEYENSSDTQGILGALNNSLKPSGNYMYHIL